MIIWTNLLIQKGKIEKYVILGNMKVIENDLIIIDGFRKIFVFFIEWCQNSKYIKLLSLIKNFSLMVLWFEILDSAIDGI